jgi:hypothetical protein
MLKVFQNDTVGIQKSMLRQHKGNAVFFLVDAVFVGIPFKIGSLFHIGMIGLEKSFCQYEDMAFYMAYASAS